MDARRKNLIVAFALTFTGVLTFLVWKSLYHREPFYSGKPLSAWAQQYRSNRTGNKALAQEAEFAIRQIGTNGIPFLLDLMQATDSGMKKKLRTILPRTWQDKSYLRDRSSDIRRIGARGLAALGTNAHAAVPALIEIASNHPDEDSRYIAVNALRTLGSASEPAIPFLIQCLTNQTRIIRDDAALGLGYMQRRPEIAVPALIRYLESVKTLSGGWEITDAIAAVAQFGTNAKPAVPILIGLLKHSDHDVRSYVTNYLPQIDADAAAKAGVRQQPQ